MPDDSVPLFVFGYHRGGTTYLQRLINVHPDVVVWGENGGVMSSLRRAHARAERIKPIDPEERDVLGDPTAGFLPWATPFDREGLLRSFADLLVSLYGRDGAAYWGFKEIRHGNSADLTFLRSMFPQGRLMTVVRHPRDILMSQLRVRWGPPVGRLDSPHYIQGFFTRYGRTAGAFVAARRQAPDLVRIAVYEDLRDQSYVHALFDWLGLELGKAEKKRLRAVQSARVGSSHRDLARQLDRAVVENAEKQFAAALPVFLDQVGDDLRGELLTWYPDLVT